MVSKRNKRYQRSFCSGLFWVWNYWMLCSWISMKKMQERVLGQFRDGTSWKEAWIHCRNLVLKSPREAGETVWNYVQQGRYNAQHRAPSQWQGENHLRRRRGFRTISEGGNSEPSPAAGILRSGAEGRSHGRATPCCRSKLSQFPRLQERKPSLKAAQLCFLSAPRQRTATEGGEEASERLGIELPI